MDQQPPHPQAPGTQEVSGQPPEPPIPIDQIALQEPISHRTVGSSHQEERIGWPSWIQAIAAVIMVIVTSIYAYYAARQWQTLRDQLNAFQTTEGAHFGVGRFEFDVSTGRVAIPIVNYGKIPSPRASIFVHVYKTHSGEQAPFYAQHYNFGGDRTQIPPGADKYGVTVPVELAQSEIEKIQTGQEQLSVFVVIRYDNGFGKVSQPGFCFSYAPTRRGAWDACGPVVSFEDLQKMTPTK